MPSTHQLGRLPRMHCADCDFAAHHLDDLRWHDKCTDHVFKPATLADLDAIAAAAASVLAARVEV